MAALASDWLRYFRLLLWNCWTEFNETCQEGISQRPLPSLCFSGRSENKMAALASDWLRHFQLLLWNCWTEFNKTWQEARSRRPLPSSCFSGRSEKQDGCPVLWLAETFSTSPLKPLNGIQRNLTGSKISTSSTKFKFCRPISKQKCQPLPIPKKGGTLYSGARYVALWALVKGFNSSTAMVLNLNHIHIQWHSSVQDSPGSQSYGMPYKRLLINTNMMQIYFVWSLFVKVNYFKHFQVCVCRICRQGFSSHSASVRRISLQGQTNQGKVATAQALDESLFRGRQIKVK